MYAFLGFNQYFNLGMFPQTFNTFPVFNFSYFNTNFYTNYSMNFSTIFNNNFNNNFYNQNFNANFGCFSPFNSNSTITFNNFNKTFVTNTPKAKTEKRDISYDAKTLKETWKNKKPDLTDEFYDRVIEISKRIKCDPNELMGVMNSESGIDHQAVNKKSNATGLIQFMPSTAESLGTTTDKLKSMSAVEQLDYVEKYLVKQKKVAGFSDNRQLSAGELYALVFLPARANRSVLTTQGEKYYSWNKGLDRNKDGRITKAELDTRIKQDFMA